MQFEESERLRLLPPYTFAEISKIIEKKRNQGLDVISLGIGDPDIPTQEDIIKVLCQEAKNPENHRYPSSYGLKFFKEAVASFYHERFNVKIDPDREVIPLLGSKEGISDLTYTYINRDDFAIITDPAYLVFKISTIFAGGRTYAIPLKKENDFLFDIGDIDKEVAVKSKVLFFNYPNNPTTATCDVGFFQKVAEFAERNNIIICHDNAYSDVYYGEKRPPSFLSADGAKDVGIELNSLSKTFNMTGWRIGYAVGNREIIGSIGKYKSNVDSGIFNAVQYAAAEALNNYKKYADHNNQVYKKRRDIVKRVLDDVRIKYYDSYATIYVWAEVPERFTSESFSKMLLEKANVVVTPGKVFGKYGEGYIRISLTIEDNRLKEALNRIKNVL